MNIERVDCKQHESNKTKQNQEEGEMKLILEVDVKNDFHKLNLFVIHLLAFKRT